MNTEVVLYEIGNEYKVMNCAVVHSIGSEGYWYHGKLQKYCVHHCSSTKGIFSDLKPIKLRVV